MKKKMICFGLILFFAFILNCRAGSNDTNIKIEYMDNTYTNLNLLKPHPEMSSTTFTKMNNEKRLVTSKTQKNFLLPIKGKHKYDNAVLFELREINMKEKNKKNIFKNFFKKSCIYENNVLPL